ncbi:MAG: hypothetical protein ACF8K1_12305 [Phycisphaerales bacterium JB047]
MLKRCVLPVIAMTTLLSGSPANADDLSSLARASSLRAQPDSRHEPAWFVDRADNSSLRLSVLTQTRYTLSNRESGFTPTDNTATIGFSMPRTQVAMEGNIVSSQFNYKVSFDFGDAELSRGRGNAPALAGSTGTPMLLDAYAQYNFSGKREGYYLKFGQFQSIVNTEEAVDSSMQLAIDRSMISELFGPGYTQGIAVGRVLESYAWEISVNDGGRFIGKRESDNTAFNSGNESDLGVSGRFDWKIKGDWQQFSDFTSWRGSNEAAKLGAGFIYQFNGQTNPGINSPPFLAVMTDSGQYVTWTVDYQYENDGWNFFAAYTGMWVDFEFAGGTLGSWHNGLLAQGGWFISESSELYARAEVFWIDKDYRNGFGLPNGYIHRLLTVGVNKYLIPESHAAKLSADFSYAFDSLSVLSVGPDSMVLPDPGVTGFLGLTDEEFVFRMQLQLLF